MSPEGMIVAYILRFKFLTINNEAEYEALAPNSQEVGDTKFEGLW